MHIRKTLKESATVLQQREFWQQTIRVPRRVGPTLYLRVDLHHYRMLLRSMVLLVDQCLHAHMQMVLLQAQFHLFDHHHHRHKLQHSHPCKWLDKPLGKVSHSI